MTPRKTHPEATTEYRIPEAVFEAIREILDYLFDDERKHFLAEPSPGHIFHSIETVDAWLERIRPK